MELSAGHSAELNKPNKKANIGHYLSFVETRINVDLNVE